MKAIVKNHDNSLLHSLVVINSNAKISRKNQGHGPVTVFVLALVFPLLISYHKINIFYCLQH